GPCRKGVAKGNQGKRRGPAGGGCPGGGRAGTERPNVARTAAFRLPRTSRMKSPSRKARPRKRLKGVGEFPTADLRGGAAVHRAQERRPLVSLPQRGAARPWMPGWRPCPREEISHPANQG